MKLTKMKRVFLITAFILSLGANFGQVLQQGDIIRTSTITFNLQSGATEEQFIEYLRSKYIPECEKAWEGHKMYLGKSIEGENIHSLGIIAIVESEYRYKYVDAKGDLTEAGLNALNKTAPIVLELIKIAEYQFIDHGEWIIQ